MASYRKTTLTALQQVEDNIAALRILEQEAQQQKDATASVRESLQVFTDRYIGGADPYLQVLTAQTIALQNERTHVDILRRRMDASVLLIKALRRWMEHIAIANGSGTPTYVNSLAPDELN